MNSLSPFPILFKLLKRVIARAPAASLPRVLLVTQYLFLGGLERMVFNLATSLKADLQWEPTVFVFDHDETADPATHLGSLFRAESIAVVTFSKPRGFSPKAVWKMLQIVVSQEIAVIHTHDLGALIYGAMVKIGCLGSVRLVHTQHSFVHLGRKKRYRYYEMVFALLVDKLTVVSPDTLETYRSLGVSPDKITVVPNGVRFPMRQANKVEAKREALSLLDDGKAKGLNPYRDTRWILYMARLHGRKGQNHAIRLWCALDPEVRAKTALLFVGLETERGQLEELLRLIGQAPDRERIFYLGPTHQPMQWLQAADVFLSCSEFEGMPLASIEAAGSGLPLVLSSIVGHESLKSWSHQYPLENPEEGALQMWKIVSDMEKGGSHFFDSQWLLSESIRSRYSVVQMAATYSRLYNNSGIL